MTNTLSMIKLISFDIGIKNMAYCIFILDPSQNEILTIEDWGILNLMTSTSENSNTNKTQQCTCHSKPPNKKTPAKPCTRKAIFEKNGMFYCSAHAEKSEWILPFDQWKKRKQMSKEDLILLGQTHSAFSTTISPKSTKKECLAYLEEWFLAKVLVPIQKQKEKKAGSMDLITLGRNMTECLDKMEKAKNPTHVIMENQISPIATRMKTIQGMLAQYYIMDPTHPHIEFISSANKLKHLVAEKPTAEQNTYKQHKLDSIEFCKRFLEINHFTKKDSSSWISNTSKKDDLADCFLQGIWYLKTQKLITCADDLKIKCV
jgi:Mitochondrial resolvase Ydc2 / RNA splicing MRS1